jgi:predicted transcriptional regulator
MSTIADRYYFALHIGMWAFSCFPYSVIQTTEQPRSIINRHLFESIRTLLKRSKLEITAQILQVAATEEGMRKTWIKARASLSNKQLNEYLKRLFESGCIEYLPGVRMFRTSAKGMEFLTSYQRFSDVLMSGGTVAPEKTTH